LERDLGEVEAIYPFDLALPITSLTDKSVTDGRRQSSLRGATLIDQAECRQSFRDIERKGG